MNAKKHGPRPKRLPDEGAAVDEHGRPPKAPSRTGPGSSPPSDPARVERAGKEGTHQKAGAKLPTESGGERATCNGGPNAREPALSGSRSARPDLRPAACEAVASGWRTLHIAAR
ncbi:hypothetical protein GCM10010425_50400 [Streptomyces spororaveus]|uniref:Uncharacterized protein n=1 Tax=Streptomyces spororaveus TaxID=284039 RepID=A0ABQ3T2L9_9ACTN|nr:hypothetical protein Sspor_01950 [Streptomyces spororaveus]